MADLPTAVVLDIDGVLADVRHRLHRLATRPRAWEEFFAAARDDRVLPEGLQLAGAAADRGEVVVYLTGRPERWRAQTEGWLVRNGFPPGELLMRGDTDRRPARLTKVGELRRLSRRLRIRSVVDDDAAVVEAVRAAGFTALHATWMQPSTSGTGSGSGSQAVLFEVQEGEGRT